jgi:hypothetical protein
VAELTGQAWQEMSGYDGRILATLRGLLRPGQLTEDYVSGRRAHYLPPLRVYLTVSVLYFVIAAAAPTRIGGENGRPVPAGGLRVEVAGRDSGGVLSDADRAELRAQLAETPRLLRPMLERMLDDPDAFRARVFTTMPRVFFGMLPVFAGIVALFHRGRTFSAAMVFAVHLHSFAFVVFAIAELAKFTNSAILAVGAGVIALLLVGAYLLLASRRVYGGSWPAIIAKSVGLAFVYLLASIPAFAIILAWATM